MIYKIQHRIHTLTQNAVMKDGSHALGFETESINFTHWEFNYRDGWLQDFWLAEGEIVASTVVDAINNFRARLNSIVPKIALISQCYIECHNEPWLVTKSESNISLYRHIKERSGVGLMFMENEKEALDRLLKEKTIPEEFYYYWNDAVNCTGYLPKLLLMFSAVESLAGKVSGKKDWGKMKKILGEDLKKDLYGTKENPKVGLRHRLTHGEYFNGADKDKDYLELIHKAVLLYFNQTIFQEEVLELSIVQPQRHFFGNKEGGFIFLKSESSPTLKELIKEFEEDGPKSTETYELIFDKGLRESF